MNVMLFANTDWYLYNFRRSLAEALKDAGHDVLLVSPPGPYGERLRSLGFRWEPAPMQRKSLNPLRELFLLFWLWRLARREKPQIVHGFTIKCAVYGALIARMVGAARVNAVAGMGYVFISDAPKARILRPLVKTLMRFAIGGLNARLILQNPDDVAFFLQTGIARGEIIRLIPGSGVDCQRFHPPGIGNPDAAEKPLRIVLASRILWDKGIAEFIEAARILRLEGRNLHFVLAGEPDSGNPAAIPENNVREWQSEGLIEWLGHVDDMPALLAGADIVVLPSYREGLPKSLIEAAACARPLVTCDVPGCRHVVRDEVDGLLVPPRDAKALARAIARLQDDSELAMRLGNSAHLRALTEFDERIVIGRTIATYKELVNENDAPAAPLVASDR